MTEQEDVATIADTTAQFRRAIDILRALKAREIEHRENSGRISHQIAVDLVVAQGNARLLMNELMLLQTGMTPLSLQDLFL